LRCTRLVCCAGALGTRSWRYTFFAASLTPIAHAARSISVYASPLFANHLARGSCCGYFRIPARWHSPAYLPYCHCFLLRAGAITCRACAAPTPWLHAPHACTAFLLGADCGYGAARFAAHAHHGSIDRSPLFHPALTDKTGTGCRGRCAWEAWLWPVLLRAFTLLPAAPPQPPPTTCISTSLPTGGFRGPCLACRIAPVRCANARLLLPSIEPATLAHTLNCCLARLPSGHFAVYRGASRTPTGCGSLQFMDPSCCCARCCHTPLLVLPDVAAQARHHRRRLPWVSARSGSSYLDGISL